MLEFEAIASGGLHLWAHVRETYLNKVSPGYCVLHPMISILFCVSNKIPLELTSHARLTSVPLVQRFPCTVLDPTLLFHTGRVKRFSHWVTRSRFWADVKNSTIGSNANFCRRRQLRKRPRITNVNTSRVRFYSWVFKTTCTAPVTGGTRGMTSPMTCSRTLAEPRDYVTPHSPSPVSLTLHKVSRAGPGQEPPADPGGGARDLVENTSPQTALNTQLFRF